MMLMDWTDVNLVVRIIVDNKIHLEGLNSDDGYGIEKATDLIFGLVRDKQIEDRKKFAHNGI